MAANTLGKFNKGSDALAGATNKDHYLDMAGIDAATQKNIYGQFADRKHQPLKHGDEYRITRWLHVFDNELFKSDVAKGNVYDETKDKGFISYRNVKDFNSNVRSKAGGTAIGGANTDVGRSLQEGQTNENIIQPKRITLKTKFAKYGAQIEYTDAEELFYDDNIQVRYREELGYDANQLIEDLIQYDMLSSTNIVLAGTATTKPSLSTGISHETTGVSAAVNYDLIRKCDQILSRNLTPKSTKMVTGSEKVDTKTVNAAYYCIYPAALKPSLEDILRDGTSSRKSDTYQWVPIYQYHSASQDKTAEGEEGRIHNVCFIEAQTGMVFKGGGAKVLAADTTGGSTAGSSASKTLMSTDMSGANNYRYDVFPMIFPGEGSYATVGLRGQGKVKFHSISPSEISHSNPFASRGFFSYTLWHAGIILQEERLLVAYAAGKKL